MVYRETSYRNSHSHTTRSLSTPGFRMEFAFLRATDAPAIGFYSVRYSGKGSWINTPVFTIGKIVPD